MEYQADYMTRFGSEVLVDEMIKNALTENL